MLFYSKKFKELTINYVNPLGKAMFINFHGGQYWTDDEDEISFLTGHKDVETSDEMFARKKDRLQKQQKALEAEIKAEEKRQKKIDEAMKNNTAQSENSEPVLPPQSNISDIKL